MFTASDHQYMAHALQLAEQGLYSTAPNPRVGCVIVKQNKIVGEGAHLKAGEPHAEVHALRIAGAHARGATVYVTLEPCSHHGRTPPCAEALLQAGVTKVIAAMVDPNPMVAGKGLAFLKAHGVEAVAGLLALQAQVLNAGFISRMTQQRPWVRMKVASSLDGKTALENNQSQWITSPQARMDVQHWRAQSCAILTGIGTVLADNPQLTVRDIDTQRQPLRVVVDSQLNTPLEANLLKQGNTLVAYVTDAHGKTQRLADAGVRLLQTPDRHGRVCLQTLLQTLAMMQMNEVMVEAGQVLNGALVNAKLVDELLLYIAPKLMGGYAKSMLQIPSLTDMNQARPMQIFDLRQIGPDIRIRAHFLAK